MSDRDLTGPPADATGAGAGGAGATGAGAGGARVRDRLRAPGRGALVVLGLLLLAGYVRAAVGYGVGTPSRPGPGFFPLVAAAVVALGAVGALVERGRSAPVTEARDATTVDLTSPASPWRALGVLALCLAYVFLVPAVGDLAGGIGLAVGVLLVMGNRLWFVLVGGVLLGLGAHYLFVTVLGIPLGHGSGL
jgi:putative tricarboxylic transport membrane protein